MLDNLTYGPHGYSTHEESFAVENEYHNSHSGSLQMMPPHCIESPPYSKQHMSYGNATHGSYPDGWHGKTNKYQNGWHGQGGWSSSSGLYNHGPSGNLPGMPMLAPGRMPSNNRMMSAEYETYHAAPGRMRMQNYGTHTESYDDYASGVHNGHQKVEWKAL